MSARFAQSFTSGSRSCAMRCHLPRLGCLLLAACGLAMLGDRPSVHGQTKKAKKNEQAFELFGEPKGFKVGDSVRYAVWATKKGWHIRTTTAKKLHHFTGKIHIDGGTVIGLESHTLELEHKGKFADWWRLHEKRHEIVIDFKTDRG